MASTTATCLATAEITLTIRPVLNAQAAAFARSFKVIHARLPQFLPLDQTVPRFAETASTGTLTPPSVTMETGETTTAVPAIASLRRASSATSPQS